VELSWDLLRWRTSEGAEAGQQLVPVALIE